MSGGHWEQIVRWHESGVPLFVADYAEDGSVVIIPVEVREVPASAGGAAVLRAGQATPYPQRNYLHVSDSEEGAVAIISAGDADYAQDLQCRLDAVRARQAAVAAWRNSRTAGKGATEVKHG